MGNSINEQQPEQNHQDLAGAPATAKIKELAEGNACFFCTAISTNKKFETRPMTVQKVDENGALWFLSASDSGQNAEIARDANVQLLFQGSPHSEFLTLYGRATISRERQKIDELWSPLYKTWFTEGKDDARITVIRVDPGEGYYWDTKHNRMIAFAKMVAGAVVGKTLDDSIEGKLRV
ncbi:MAG TPA: pyridoxamine 5'-phosphate oxidase family protein [Kofleriaceae bacterium]